VDIAKPLSSTTLNQEQQECLLQKQQQLKQQRQLIRKAQRVAIATGRSNKPNQNAITITIAEFVI
jgi:hypothetical protein